MKQINEKIVALRSYQVTIMRTTNTFEDQLIEQLYSIGKLKIRSILEQIEQDINETDYR